MTTFPVALPGATADTLMWADPADVEPAALDQLRRISALPWAHALRVMPDVHLGKGATIGSVIAMAGAVSPSAVGVDIGCGMGAVRTTLTADDLPDDLGALRRQLERVVPVGFGGHRDEAPILAHDADLRARFTSLMGRFDDLTAAHTGELRPKALQQCGSLGGGNHFIELCSDATGRIWLTLHSGSRGIGNQLAQRHISIARALEHNSALPDRDLAVFLAGTPQMDDYVHDLTWAQQYAWLNRQLILAALTRVLRDELPGIGFDAPILCHHNYVALETYNGVELIITRKGAIRAGAGELGLIPGSMGTGSYVVRGLGNEASLCSASHGAGRRMSRTAAKKRFTEADLAAQTAGIECRKDSGVIDEIPGAYKDIDAVIAAQRDLVEVVARLDTLLCIKG